jgi:hypothetical protein
MTETFTKAEREDLKHVEQDILLFLRLAELRIEERDTQPFKAASGRLVISWLRALARSYGNGEAI